MSKFDCTIPSVFTECYIMSNVWEECTNRRATLTLPKSTLTAGTCRFVSGTSCTDCGQLQSSADIYKSSLLTVRTSKNAENADTRQELWTKKIKFFTYTEKLSRLLHRYWILSRLARTLGFCYGFRQVLVKSGVHCTTTVKVQVLRLQQGSVCDRETEK